MTDFDPIPLNHQRNETKGPVLPTTGIAIPLSPTRRILQEFIRQTSKEPSEEAIARSTRQFDAIGQTPGFSIVERRDIGEDIKNKYRCAEYAFLTVNQEPWELEEDGRDRTNFLLDRHEFITNHGYEVVTDTPQAGDVIAYGYWYDRTKWGNYEHFGIYEGNGQVVSKFNEGHIYRHPWDLIPDDFGNNVVFFRKLSKKS